ncbi:hypothetical protein DSCO28_09830 [Desulfosarcina ovata subsp. sediminis]|uniref:Uncharacterized protein n=1 Tax=Desulfosarcina ovata subsp. sediminis TaxID=885957 RepID=A0A5K7ZKB2_9BACT|nr:hypothetical protein [Desulfosarcina ovata]BBO80417.1 hypothetical protein DSCO28_09830 [Desulfosarcina ovata subsp. sediminis]
MVVNRKKGGKYSLEFAHDMVAINSDVQLAWESPTRVKVIETGEDVWRIAKIIGNGLTVPFAPDGPSFRPGEGGETIICDVGGKPLRTRRELEREQQLADTAVAACPTLATVGESDAGLWQWDLPDPETCLETLMELNALDPRQKGKRLVRPIR